MKNQGIAVSRLPEQFLQGPRTSTLDAYIANKYGVYGFKKQHPIEYNPEFHPSYNKRATYRWVEHVSDGLRRVGASHDIIHGAAIGWYVDNYQSETVHGEVYQLPTHNGLSCYIPGVNDPYNDDCTLLDFGSIADNKEDAARWADHMAEAWAESAREDEAREDARQRIEDINENIRQLYEGFRAEVRELRAVSRAIKGIPVVQRLVQSEWRKIKAEIHKLRKERERIVRNGIEYN